MTDFYNFYQGEHQAAKEVAFKSTAAPSNLLVASELNNFPDLTSSTSYTVDGMKQNSSRSIHNRGHKESSRNSFDVNRSNPIVLDTTVSHYNPKLTNDKTTLTVSNNNSDDTDVQSEDHFDIRFDIRL